MGDIDRGAFAKAVEKGQQLRKARFSGAFEVLSRAYSGLGDHAAAMEILREGTRLVPQSWILWKLLGDALSDDSEFKAAHGAYKRGLQCVGANRDLIAYNQAIVFARESNIEEALALCATLQTDDWSLRAGALAVSILIDARRWDEAIERADSLLAANSGADRAHGQAHLGSQLRGARARALLTGRNDPSAALESANEAIAGGFDPVAASVLREIGNQRAAPSSRRMELVIQGRATRSIEGSKAIPHFFRNFEVIADSPEEALQFVLPFHPTDERASLRVDSTVRNDPAAGELKGVYFATGYIFYED